MDNVQEFVADCLEHLQRGEAGKVLHPLMEVDPVALPVLMDAFARTKDDEIRALLLHCIWQHRLPESIDFLACVVRDDAGEAWKEALDGLVAIGGDTAERALQSDLDTTQDSIKLEWIEEALQQIRPGESP